MPLGTVCEKGTGTKGLSFFADILYLKAQISTSNRSHARLQPVQGIDNQQFAVKLRGTYFIPKALVIRCTKNTPIFITNNPKIHKPHWLIVGIGLTTGPLLLIKKYKSKAAIAE